MPYALTRLCQQQCLKATLSIGPVYNFPRNRFVSVQTGLKRERETTNKIKCKTKQNQEGKAAAELLPNESHVTVDVSLLASSSAKVTSCSFANLFYSKCKLCSLSQQMCSWYKYEGCAM